MFAASTPFMSDGWISQCVVSSGTGLFTNIEMSAVSTSATSKYSMIPSGTIKSINRLCARKISHCVFVFVYSQIAGELATALFTPVPPFLIV